MQSMGPSRGHYWEESSSQLFPQALFQLTGRTLIKQNKFSDHSCFAVFIFKLRTSTCRSCQPVRWMTRKTRDNYTLSSVILAFQAKNEIFMPVSSLIYRCLAFTSCHGASLYVIPKETTNWVVSNHCDYLMQSNLS